MLEAFRQAIAELEPSEAAPRVSAPTLRLVQAVTATAEPQELPDEVMNRLAFRARKLGRAWAAATHGTVITPAQLARLRDEWALLAAPMRGARTPQRVAVLDAFVDGLDQSNAKHWSAKRAYLLRQATARPLVLAGFEVGGAVGWLSPTAYLVHAVEELADSPEEERRTLHTVVQEAAVAPGAPWPTWLLRILACWLGLRNADQVADCADESAA